LSTKSNTCPYHCILNFTNFSYSVSDCRSCLMSRFQILFFLVHFLILYINFIKQNILSK
jgi:hypothetical protein